MSHMDLLWEYLAGAHKENSFNSLRLWLVRVVFVVNAFPLSHSCVT